MFKLILPAIHLSILIGFIVYKTKGTFISFMSKRYEDVKDGLNRSKVQATEANTKKAEVEKKFANLQKEKEVIFADWKEREQAQLKAIKESSVKILALMEVESTQNKKSLEEQIRAQILKKLADQILANVETKVKTGLTSDLHKNINEQFMKEVSA